VFAWFLMIVTLRNLEKFSVFFKAICICVFFRLNKKVSKINGKFFTVIVHLLNTKKMTAKLKK